MVFNEYTKRRVVFYHAKGHRAPKIAKLLEAEGIKVSRRGVSDFLVRMEQTGDFASGSGRPSKQTDDVKAIIEGAMRTDDETTVKQLCEQLTSCSRKNTV